jgi:uncharacterized coiled-coil DUF342 family protein
MSMTSMRGHAMESEEYIIMAEELNDVKGQVENLRDDVDAGKAEKQQLQNKLEAVEHENSEITQQLNELLQNYNDERSLSSVSSDRLRGRIADLESFVVEMDEVARA